MTNVSYQGEPPVIGYSGGVTITIGFCGIDHDDGDS